jgi:hypothetical protein
MMLPPLIDLDARWLTFVDCLAGNLARRGPMPGTAATVHHCLSRMSPPAADTAARLLLHALDEWEASYTVENPNVFRCSECGHVFRWEMLGGFDRQTKYCESCCDMGANI